MVYTSYPFPPARKVFLVHPDMPVITQYEDLKGKEILIHTGKSYFDRFDNDSSLRKYPVSDYDQAIKMIHANRSDVLIIPEREGDYLMKQLGIRLKKSPYLIKGRNSFITISKKSPILALQKKIEESLIQMDRDGTTEKILDRYRLMNQ